MERSAKRDLLVKTQVASPRGCSVEAPVAVPRVLPGSQRLDNRRVGRSGTGDAVGVCQRIWQGGTERRRAGSGAFFFIAGNAEH